MAEQAVERKPIKAIGVIGLGRIGRSIGQRLAVQGHEAGLDKIAGFDSEAPAMEGLEKAGIIACKSIAHLTDMVDVVLLCLPAGEVGKIARQHEGLLDCVRQDQIFIDHSWSPLALTRQLATAFAGRGAHFVDAPIAKSGDVVSIIGSGQLAFAIGGDQVAADAVRPALGGYAQEITHVGAPGSAQVVRQMGDLVALQTFAALAEALTTARAFGVEGDRLFNALAKGSGGGAAFGRRGLAGLLAPSDTKSDERTSIADATRRLKEAIELAAGKNLSLTGAGSTLSMLDAAIEKGLGDEGLSTLFSTAPSKEKAAPRRPNQRQGLWRRPSEQTVDLEQS